MGAKITRGILAPRGQAAQGAKINCYTGFLASRLNCNSLFHNHLSYFRKDFSDAVGSFNSFFSPLDIMHYEGGSESSVIGVITLLIYMIGCCIIT